MKLLALAGLVAIVFGAMRVGRAQTTPPADAVPLPETGDGIDAALDKVMTAALKEFGIPGGALSVAVGGKLVVAKGYGWASVAARRPVSPQTRLLPGQREQGPDRRGDPLPGAGRAAVAGRPRLSAPGQPAAAGRLSTRRADQADHRAAIAAARRRIRRREER